MRLHRNDKVRKTWEDVVDAGLLGVCPITELELLYTARNTQHRREMVEALTAYYTWVLMPDGVYTRAAEVQELLTQQGKHRSAGPVDLLVAATAELNGRTMLHYDRDFETVAQLTGQPAAWIAPPGSID